MKDKLEFLGEKIRNLKRACEPTDLIWENKEVSPAQRKRRTIAVITLIVVICIFYFVFAVVAIQNQLFIGYILRPPGVDCDRLDAHHSDQ